MIKVYHSVTDLYSGVGRFVPETPVYWVKFYRYHSPQFHSSGSSTKTIYWELIFTENCRRICHKDQPKWDKFILCFNTCTNPFSVSCCLYDTYSFTVCQIMHLLRLSTSVSSSCNGCNSPWLYNNGFLSPTHCGVHHILKVTLSCTHFLSLPMLSET